MYFYTVSGIRESLKEAFVHYFIHGFVPQNILVSSFFCLRLIKFFFLGKLQIGLAMVIGHFFRSGPWIGFRLFSAPFLPF